MATAKKRARTPRPGAPAQVQQAGAQQAGAQQAEATFVAGVVARGEAATADPDGTLPAGATHEIVEDEKGRRLVRRRYSAS